MICPLCFSQAPFSFEIKGYPVYQCTACGHLFLQNDTNIHTQNALYDDRYFFGNQDGYNNYFENKDNLIEQGHWYADQLKKYGSPGFMLDVGAAAGYVLKGFTDKGWTGVGLEPNQNMVDYGINELGLNMVKGYLENYNSNNTFDLVSLIQVMHHFYDIRSAFEKIRNLTKPRGFLLIESWKKDSLVAFISRHRWHVFNPPTVRHWFTVRNLIDFAHQFGFEEVKQGRRFKKMKGSLLKEKVHPIFKSLIPKNMNIIYPGDDLFWILFQKNI